MSIAVDDEMLSATAMELIGVRSKLSAICSDAGESAATSTVESARQQEAAAMVMMRRVRKVLVYCMLIDALDAISDERRRE